METSNKLLYLCCILFVTIFSHAQSTTIYGTGTFDGNSHNSNSVNPKNGNGSLGMSYNKTGCGINYTYGKVNTSQLPSCFGFDTPCIGSNGSPTCGVSNGVVLPATINISGIPVGATIVDAFVYLTSIYGAGGLTNLTIVNPTLTSSSFSAELIGQHCDLGYATFGYGYSRTYRVDVTSAISGNGSYQISGFNTDTCNINGFGQFSPIWGESIHGALLFIVYKDPISTYIGNVAISDGAYSFSCGLGPNSTVNLNGFYACAEGENAKGFVLVSDLQNISNLPIGINCPIGTFNTSIPYGTQSHFDFFEEPTIVNAGQISASYTVGYSIYTNNNSSTIDYHSLALAGLYFQTNCQTTLTASFDIAVNCTGASATVDVTGGNAPYQISWNTNPIQIGATAVGLANGTYIVTITDTTLCTTIQDTIVISDVSDSIDTEFTYLGPFCQNETNPSPIFAPGSSAGTFTSTPSGLVFEDQVLGVVDLSASTPGTYTITNTIAASGSCPGSSANASITINSLQDAGFVYQSSSYCQGNGTIAPSINGTLGGTFTSTPAGLIIDSQTGEIDLSSPANSYTISYSTPGPCASSSSQVIQIGSVFFIDVSSDEICEGEEAILTGTPSVTGGTYLWTPGGEITSSITVSPNITADYTVTYTLGSCSAMDVGTVVVNGYPTANISTPSTTITSGETIQLQANGADSYLWSTGETGDMISVSPNENTSYCLLVIDNGCADSTCITIEIGCESVLYAPNCITANGDLVNDDFIVKGDCLSEYHLLIFNRWGELIFETFDILDSWDGTYKTKAVPDGVYTYLIYARGFDNEFYNPHGFVTIVR